MPVSFPLHPHALASVLRHYNWTCPVLLPVRGAMIYYRCNIIVADLADKDLGALHECMVGPVSSWKVRNAYF